MIVVSQVGQLVQVIYNYRKNPIVKKILNIEYLDHLGQLGQFLSLEGDE